MTFPLRPHYNRVEYTYVFECCFCQLTQRSNWKALRGDSAVIPTLPQSWTELPDGRLACGQHEVKVFVDGQVAFP